MPVDLNFPFKNDREAVKHRSRIYKDFTITEAFSKEYGLKLDNHEVANEVPAELCVGDTIKIKIRSISKSGVAFDSGNFKCSFDTRNNLWSYKKFREFVPTGYVKARVTDINKGHTFVDLITPMIEDFILPRAQSPWIQCTEEPEVVVVKNLTLVRGGFIGDAVIPNVSEWLGEDYTVKTFIPGSQIALNTTKDFDSYVGATIETFISSYNPVSRGGASLVCSAKDYLRHLGNLELQQIFSIWCDAGDSWDILSHTEWVGAVTGVIHSANKCGVFVEIPELNITGMINCKPDQLVEFQYGLLVPVYISAIEEPTYYNPTVGQHQKQEPFVTENGCIKRVNIRPVLSFVTE